jgi:uncharacterized protein
VAAVAAALADGALMGARGNSGVIMSQVLAGLADALDGKRHAAGVDLARGLDEGSRRAYAAVAHPVEGTILTVIREAADAGTTAARRDDHVDAVLAAAVTAARRAVRRTPSLLAILRESGVVDAGGQALYLLLDGARRDARARTSPRRGRPGAAPRLVVRSGGRSLAPSRPSMQSPSERTAPARPAGRAFGYEMMFLLHAHREDPIDVPEVRARLEQLGESVVVAGDPSAAKVHVHTSQPDAVIAFALRLGSLTEITIEDLDEQVAAEHATVGGGDRSGRRDAADDTEGHVAQLVPLEPYAADRHRAARVPLATLAVVSGDGLAAAFASFGVETIRGGQSDNPSVRDLTDAIEQANADDVLLLPNNPNALLAARQAAAVAARRTPPTDVHVVPTRNAAEGLASVIELDSQRSAAANAASMAAAARAVRTLLVAPAIRDATIAGRHVGRGDTIVLDPDDGLVAVGRDEDAAVVDGLHALDGGFELVTLYRGAAVDGAAADALAERIREAWRDVEVEVVNGGQPHHRYVISAE